MTDLPRISIIVPVYNASNTLVLSVESLLNQTLKNLEIILINDASTDDSGAVIERLARDYSNIVAIHFSENKGPYEARLAGLKKSSGDWIGFLDADDFARPQMFSTLLSAAINNDVDIVVCGTDRVTAQRKVVAPKLRFHHSKKIDVDVFERFCSFEFGTGMLWNKLFKRSIIEPWFDLHFPWRQDLNEDLLLNIGCFYNAKSVFLVREVLHEYVLSGDGITSQMKNSWAYVETYRAYSLAVSCYQKLGSSALFNIIDMYRTQLCWSSYQLDKTAELAEYKERLQEATHLLCDKNPYSLAAISARQHRSRFAIRDRLKSLYFSLVNKVKRSPY